MSKIVYIIFRIELQAPQEGEQNSPEEFLGAVLYAVIDGN